MICYIYHYAIPNVFYRISSLAAAHSVGWVFLPPQDSEQSLEFSAIRHWKFSNIF